MQTNTAAYVAPTSDASVSGNSWPSDNVTPSNDTLRPHPRLIAPQYKWDALRNGLIAQNPYFEQWNRTIVANASESLNDDPTPYIVDGDSGVLDVAREIKLKVKNWAYAYRITGNTQYADRVWRELWVSCLDRVETYNRSRHRPPRATTLKSRLVPTIRHAGIRTISSMLLNSPLLSLSATTGATTSSPKSVVMPSCGR